ncbi:hypothetical protein FH972_023439 [Carpinus fangiana]|uniref:G domain-containing protein n=1 Tax=Carpinus fangiana TaxID=176857 RepID=A0A5N6KVK8_9ROSI|nr:hypothetical protein FH972_023439 [Carpinus fangiana]
MRRAKGVVREAPDGSTYITTEKQEAAWVKMRSVTEQPALDEFLSTAELAGTDFTAEKMNNVRIIHRDQKNPYLLSAAEERATVKKQNAHRKRLTVPRRPQWDASTSKTELEERERMSLLDWRRGLAELQEQDDLLMTPFERNLEVWRQLWRVIERSDLVVQIVDARNPLMFRSDDLERYVKEVDQKKNNLLLVNKADMMTLQQRRIWASYFKRAGINFRFFSAELAKDMNALREAEYASQEESSEESSEEDEDSASEDSDDGDMAAHTKKLNLQEQQMDEEPETSEEEVDIKPAKSRSVDATRIITTEDLEALFLEHAPERDTGQDKDGAQHKKTTIGLAFLEAIYGMKIVTRPLEEGGTGHPTGEEVLRAYASARGFSTQGVGAPDESRAARYILKDYVKGKLLFCHPPPTTPPIDPGQFNRGLYDASHLPEKRRAHMVSHDERNIDGSTDAALQDEGDMVPLPPVQGTKTQAMDQRFFGPGSGNAGHMSKPLHQQLQERATVSGKELTGRKLKTMAALEKNVDPSEIRTNSKKHFKANKRKLAKARTEYV